jgi:hypothetical protein
MYSANRPGEVETGIKKIMICQIGRVFAARCGASVDAANGTARIHKDTLV